MTTSSMTSPSTTTRIGDLSGAAHVDTRGRVATAMRAASSALRSMIRTLAATLAPPWPGETRRGGTGPSLPETLAACMAAPARPPAAIVLCGPADPARAADWRPRSPRREVEVVPGAEHGGYVEGRVDAPVETVSGVGHVEAGERVGPVAEHAHPSVSSRSTWPQRRGSTSPRSRRRRLRCGPAR